MTSEPSVVNTDSQDLKYGVLSMYPGSHYLLASCSGKLDLLLAEGGGSRGQGQPLLN